MPAWLSACAHCLAQYAPSDEGPNNLANDLVQHIMALTIANKGPNMESQPSKLWTLQGEFQRTKLILEKSSDGLLSSALGDIF